MPVNASTEAKCSGPVWDRYREEAKAGISSTTASSTTLRHSADPVGFVRELGVGNSDLLTVDPMKQAEIICSQLDAGMTPEAIANETFVRLMTHYSSKSNSKSRGWNPVDAKVLTHRSATYVCPDHDLAVTAVADDW